MTDGTNSGNRGSFSTVYLFIKEKDVEEVSNEGKVDERYIEMGKNVAWLRFDKKRKERRSLL